MGLWRWVREVIADRGEHEAVPVYLERDGRRGYGFRLGVRAGFEGDEVARIPVTRRVNPEHHPVLKEVHSCEVAGRTLQAANVHALQAKVASVIDSLAPARTLPLCYFRAPALDYEVAVYAHDGDVVAPVLGGPRLRAQDLAGLRKGVCRYLVTAGYVNGPEEVELGVVRPSDLSLVAPAAVLRSLGDPDFWLPAVEGNSPEGPVVGVIGPPLRLRDGERRRAGAGPPVREQAPAAADVVALLRFVRAELGRMSEPLADPGSVYASAVRPEAWASASARTDDCHTRMAAELSGEHGGRLELAVRRTGAGDYCAALEDSEICIFLAPTQAALADAVGAYLVETGFAAPGSEVALEGTGDPGLEETDKEAEATWSR